MKSYKIFFAAAFAAVFFASCDADRASLECTVDGLPDAALVLKQLNGSVQDVLDTVKTDASGRFKYKFSVKAGEPAFFYIYKGDTRLASLLLEAGEKVSVSPVRRLNSLAMRLLIYAPLSPKEIRFMFSSAKRTRS